MAGRWVLDAAALPLSAGQVRAREAKEERLRDVVDKALGPSSGGCSAAVANALEAELLGDIESPTNA